MAPRLPTANVVALSAQGSARQWVTVGTAHWLTEDRADRAILVITLHGEPFAWREGTSPRELRVQPPRWRAGAPRSRLPTELAAWVAAQPAERLPAAAAYLREHGYTAEAEELTRRAPSPPPEAPKPVRRKTP